MLSLMDPVEIDNLQVFRDDEDPRKFYPLPDQPVIPVDDQGDAEFLFVKYLKEVASTPEEEEAGGGLVMFRSVLTIEPERRERLVAALRERLESEKAAGKKPFGHEITSTEPLLAAPLWTSGEVSLATFEAREDGLVRHATETVAPDLAGDLGASFVLELDDDGAEIFWSAFEDRDQQIPIVVAYRLTYKARVSATLSIKAERETVVKRIWGAARPYQLAGRRWKALAFNGALTPAALVDLRRGSSLPVRAMVLRPRLREVLHQSIVDHEIEVRIETDSAAGSGDQSVQDALFQLATEMLTDRVLPALFGDEGGQPAEGGGELVEVREDGGDAGVSFDFHLRHDSTVERAVNPNGPLHLLLDGPDAVASSFKELRLSDGFFSLMKVTAATSGVHFERDGIASVHVFFEYEERDEKNPDRPWVRRRHDGVLRSEEDAVHWRFDTARRADGGHKRDYRYRTEVIYREGPRSETPPVTANSRQLLITPRALGALRVELALTAGSEVVDSARVALRHRTASGRLYEKRLELTPAGDRRTWFQHTGELAPEGDGPGGPEYEYQVTYRSRGNEIVMPWVATREETLEIASPFQRVLTFLIRPQGSFDGVSHVAGDLVYDDPGHRYRVQQGFQLGSLTDGTRIDVPVLEGGPEVARWSARVVHQDGTSRELDGGEVPAGTVWIGGETAFLEVEIRGDLLDFESDVRLAVVTLSRDGARETFVFSKDSPGPFTWRVGIADAADDAYDAHVRFIAHDRSQSSEQTLPGSRDTVLLLDRAGH